MERAVLKSFAAQERSKFPGGVELPTEFAVRFRLQNCVSLFVSQALCAADHAFGKARIFCASAFIELNENGMGEAIDARIQTANSVAQSFRQHRNNSIWQINAVAAPPRFPLHSAVRTDLTDTITHPYPEPPPLAH